MDKVKFPPALWSVHPEDIADEAKSVVGLLEFDGVGPIKLTIPSGVLLDWPSIQLEGGGSIQISTVEPLGASAVYGFSQDGKYYALRNVTSRGSSVSYPGLYRQNLHGMSLLQSRHPLGRDFEVVVACIHLPGLREWVGQVPFEAFSRRDRGNLKGVSFVYETGMMNSLILMENDNVKISIEGTASRPGGRIPSYDFEFSTDRFLRVELLSGSLAIDEMLDSWIFPVLHFLSFCMGFNYAASKVEFTTSDQLHVSYYAPLVGRQGSPSDEQFDVMPLTYGKIKDQIEGMIRAWIGFDSYARNASSMCVSLMGDWNMPLDMRFLASAQALEAMSRHNVEEKEITDDELAERVTVIKGSALPGRIRRWATYKLAHANWKSANQLADSLLARMEPLASYIAPDIERFKKDHREQRNAFTHRREFNDDSRLTNEELYHHTEAVYLLAYASVAITLGLTPDSVLELLLESRFKHSAFYNARKLYALPDGGTIASKPSKDATRKTQEELIDAFLLQSLFGAEKRPFPAAVKRAYRDLCRTLKYNGQDPSREKNKAEKLLENSIDQLLVEGNDQCGFDVWHRNLCMELMKVFEHLKCGFTFGHAQKWVNMALKYLYVCDPCLMGDLTNLLHAPIDSITLRAAAKEGVDPFCEKWSQMNDPNAYYAYQRKLREVVGVPLILWEFEVWNRELRQ